MLSGCAKTSSGLWPLRIAALNMTISKGTCVAHRTTPPRSNADGASNSAPVTRSGTGKGPRRDNSTSQCSRRYASLIPRLLFPNMFVSSACHRLINTAARNQYRAGNVAASRPARRSSETTLANRFMSGQTNLVGTCESRDAARSGVRVRFFSELACANRVMVLAIAIPFVTRFGLHFP